MLLVGETEFLGLAVPWIPRQERDGFHIQTVPHRNGRLLVDDYAAAITSKTRLILLSSVQWNNGFRADLAAFSQAGAERGILLVVDAIQQLGVYQWTLARHRSISSFAEGTNGSMPRRGAASCTSIRTRGGIDAAGLGVSKHSNTAGRLARYFGTPSIPAVRLFMNSFRRRGALRWEAPSNYPGNVVLAASVALVNELGREAIADHIPALRDAA